MKGLRWLLVVGIGLSVVVGFVYWHFIQLARAGVIGVTRGPGPSQDENPVNAYGTGLAVCVFVAVVCLIALMPVRWSRLKPSRPEPTRPSEPGDRSGPSVKQTARRIRRQNVSRTPPGGTSV